MVRSTNLFFLLLLYFIGTLCDELLDVNIMTRHGSRTPLYFPPYDQYNWGISQDKKGQLTQSGVEQHKRLGMKLAEKYIEGLKFLSEEYNLDEFDVRSTFSERTNLSALSLLSGMFLDKKVGEDGSLGRLRFQPFVANANEDFVLKGNNDCDAYNQFMDVSLRESEAYKKYDAQCSDVISRVNKLFGYATPEESWNIMAYYDPLIAGIKEFGTYPNTLASSDEWKAFTEEIIDCYIQINHLTIPTNPNTLEGVEPDPNSPTGDENKGYVTLLRKSQTSFYTDILYNFRSAINKNKQDLTVNKFHLYSSHDTNELMAEAGLDIWDGYHIPPYATHMIMELWHSERFGFYVKWTVNDFIDDVLKDTGVPSQINGGDSQELMYFETGQRTVHLQLKRCVEAAKELWGDLLNPGEEIPGCPYNTVVGLFGEAIADGGGVPLKNLESSDLTGTSALVNEYFLRSCYIDPRKSDVFGWLTPTFTTLITTSIATIIVIVVVALCKGAFWCKACNKKAGILINNGEHQNYNTYGVENPSSTGAAPSSDLEDP